MIVSVWSRLIILPSWILYDGKRGDETICLGLAEALGLEPELRRVEPRRPFTWLAPFGPIDPKDRPDKPGSPLTPPFPAIAIASGRRAAPYLRYLKQRSQGAIKGGIKAEIKGKTSLCEGYRRTFTIFLKDPRSKVQIADIVCVSDHDRLRGPNVISALVLPHLVTPQKLAKAKASFAPFFAHLPSPRLCILLGGDSAHHTFSDLDIQKLTNYVEEWARQGYGLMISTSRRTPNSLSKALQESLRRAPDHSYVFFDVAGQVSPPEIELQSNPYFAYLAWADVFFVTADSVNIVSEVISTGKPLYLYTPSGPGHRKINYFLEKLQQKGALRPFRGCLDEFTYTPIDTSDFFSQQIWEKYAQYYAAFPKKF